jgi:TonB family protein
MPARRSVDPGALGTSVLLHAAIVSLGAWLLARSAEREAEAPPRPQIVSVDTVPAGSIDLPKMFTGSVPGSSASAPPTQAPIAPGGGERVPRPDGVAAGRGGTDTSAAAALNLADQNDGLTLDRDPFNSPRQSQVQRLNTAKQRRSLDDRRATPSPMQLDFLATGVGSLAERRAPSRHNPGAGHWSGARPAALGGPLGAAALPNGGAEPEPGAPQAGETEPRTAAGLTGPTRGAGVSRRAAVALARPWVPRARAAVPAPVRARAQDNVDSRQEVASAVRSLVHASAAGAARSGVGPGGSAGPGLPASGANSGTGSKSTAAGHGPGSARDGSGDPNVLGYFRNIERRVEPHWRDAFPDWAVAQGRGGLAVLSITLSPAGSVLAVRVHRGSGVTEFDQNVMRAVRQAGPFGRLPAVYAARPLTLRMSFDAVNPAVGREGGGPGGRRARGP